MRNGITIKIGAAYDEVRINTEHGEVAFDRAEMRRDNKDNSANGINNLRRGIVAAYADAVPDVAKDRSKRAQRRLNKKRYDARDHFDGAYANA